MVEIRIKDKAQTAHENYLYKENDKVPNSIHTARKSMLFGAQFAQ